MIQEKATDKKFVPNGIEHFVYITLDDDVNFQEKESEIDKIVNNYTITEHRMHETRNHRSKNAPACSIYPSSIIKSGKESEITFNYELSFEDAQNALGCFNDLWNLDYIKELCIGKRGVYRTG